jgi:hypothetical protein
VTVVDTTKDRDALGRPVAETRYAEIPFAALAELLCGCQALYAAIPEPARFLALDADEELSIDLEPTAGSAVAEVGLALADPACYERAARLAALVVDGTVVIEVAEDDRQPLPARRTWWLNAPCMRGGLRARLNWRPGWRSASWRPGFPTSGGCTATRPSTAH